MKILKALTLSLFLGNVLPSAFLPSAFVPSAFALADSVPTELGLEADSVWAPEIEQMYETDVQLPAWVKQKAPEGTAIVRGLSGSAATGSARSRAIREVLMPRLEKLAAHKWSPRDRQIATQWAEIWIEKERNILEQFEQPFFKVIDGEQFPAFTREAILLDISEQKMTSLARIVNRSVRKTERLRKGIISGATGLVGVSLIFFLLLYKILDRLTRGYYAGRFRLVTAAMFLISSGLVVFVARAMLNSVGAT